jgi:hypothetical protein|tara:strand:+ start:33 stop:257 length:225 start_codon:yes stop_codon:yes gene_type:complete
VEEEEEEETALLKEKHQNDAMKDSLDHEIKHLLKLRQDLENGGEIISENDEILDNTGAQKSKDIELTDSTNQTE